MNENVIKVMTFNLRLDTPYDGENRFINRTGQVLDAIKRADADIIGFQECKDGMRDFLVNSLPGYTVVGCFRSSVLTDEATPVAFRNSLFELVELKNKWLSATPDIPGSTFGGDQSGCPRIYTAATLYHRPSGKMLRAVNTHLDHAGKQARLFGAMQIVQELSLVDLPFVLTGDLNASPRDPEIRLITDSDPTRAFGRKTVDCTCGLPGTFHDFGRIPPENRGKIDYIFTDLQPLSASAVDDPAPSGKYYSDHLALCAEIRVV